MAIPPVPATPLSERAIRNQGGLVGIGWLSGEDNDCSDVGHWQNSNGGTVTQDMTVGNQMAFGSPPTIKFTGDDNTKGGRLGWPNNDAFPKGWTVKAGHWYQLIMAYYFDDAPSPVEPIYWRVYFGAGGDISSTNIYETENGGGEQINYRSWKWLTLVWEPTDDHPIADVALQVERDIVTLENTDFSVNLGYVQIHEIPRSPTAFSSLIPDPQLNGWNYPSGGLEPYYIIATGTDNHEMSTSIYRNSWSADMYTSGLGTYRQPGTNNNSIYIYAEHPPTDLTNDGIEFDVGEDYVGMIIGEKDSDTLQMAANTSGGYMMQLRNQGGKGWAVSDDGTVNGKISDTFQWVLTAAGGLTTGTNKSAHFQTPDKARITEVRCHVGTAPTGSSLIVDINDDGTTIFTTQANRPTIAATTTDATSGDPDGGASVAKDSVITVDIDQVGATVAGSDLTVFIRGYYIW